MDYERRLAELQKREDQLKLQKRVRDKEDEVRRMDRELNPTKGQRIMDGISRGLGAVDGYLANEFGGGQPAARAAPRKKKKRKSQSRGPPRYNAPPSIFGL